MSFILTSHPAAALHLFLPDLIYFPFSDFYSPSHTLPWLQAAPLIECIVSQAAADSQAKLSALYLSCHNFSAPFLPHVCYIPACFSRSPARLCVASPAAADFFFCLFHLVLSTVSADVLLSGDKKSHLSRGVFLLSIAYIFTANTTICYVAILL